MKKKSRKRTWIIIKKPFLNFFKGLWGFILSNHDVLQVFLTIAAIALAYFLFTETQEQVREARRSNDLTEQNIAYQRNSDSINIILQKSMTDSSIALSKRIASTQKRFAKIETRAYINIESLKFKIRANDSIRVEYKTINTGKTPARYVFPGVSILYEDAIDKYAKILRGAIQRRDTIGFVYGANTIHDKTVTGSHIISTQDSINISQNLENVYLLGVIKYFDIFNERHFTWFCYRLFPDGRYSPYRKYNEAD